MQTVTQSKLVKITCLLVTITILTFLMYVGQEIIIPLIFAAFFAILLSPIVVFFEDRKVPRILAIGITMTLTFFVVAAIVYFVSFQLSLFSESLPDLEKKIQTLMTESTQWIA